MPKLFLLIGALLGALAVGIGAFGAHALKATLEANNRLDTFELASRYQFYHALAILLIGLLHHHYQHSFLQLAGYAILLGTLIFSGSLYCLAITNLKWLGAITPIGGLALVAGWLLLLAGIYQSSN